ncbi:pilin [Dasania marina]|uniref:pilin n=1 Tax=Dasania marina TaxID=471499 RepID=UPI0030D8718E
MPSPKATAGFTLIEILVVLAVIAILLTMAMPNTSHRVAQKQIKESLDLIAPFKKTIADYYLATATFPSNNSTAGLPDADKVMGNYLASVTVIDGALQLTLGNKALPQINGKQVSIRPIYVELSPASPVSWVCGFDEVPAAMQVSGDNQTNVELLQLPISCR